MPLPPSRLDKLTSPGGRWVPGDPSQGTADAATGCFHVESAHALLQAAGYLKHVHAREQGQDVHFRGQRTLYGGRLLPTLYRALTSDKTRAKRDQAIEDGLRRIEHDQRVLRDVAPYAREAVLQHYGWNTRWIDLVDNVWVALWFACHRARSAGKQDEYLHFERRTPSPPDSDGSYAYILLLSTSGAPVAGSPGLWRGPDSECIDLRMAAPSQYLRPHAQHALLLRRTGANLPELDCGHQVQGILRASLQQALAWLGDGALLGVHSLFPPPHYDIGYRNLLDTPPAGRRVLGAIQNVGP